MITIRFPKRGNPPENIPGFEREPGDPFVFHRIWKSCWFHGKLDNKDFCALLGKWINQMDCENCRHCLERKSDVRTPESNNR